MGGQDWARRDHNLEISWYCTGARPKGWHTIDFIILTVIAPTITPNCNNYKCMICNCFDFILLPTIPRSLDDPAAVTSSKHMANHSFSTTRFNASYRIQAKVKCPITSLVEAKVVVLLKSANWSINDVNPIWTLRLWLTCRCILQIPMFYFFPCANH